MGLDALFNGEYDKSDKWFRTFVRFFGIYYERLLVPWLKEKGEILAGPGIEGVLKHGTIEAIKKEARGEHELLHHSRSG